jgi:segregation and condensation protein A
MKSSELLATLIQTDDISWKQLILEAVKQKQMNPWDIDITALSSEFLTLLQKYQQMNFVVSGKVVLASALLLKLKSEQFVDEDMTVFDKIIAATQDGDMLEELLDSVQDEPYQRPAVDGSVLIPRTPQPRKRKVSVYDLIEALEKAIEVDNRRFTRKTGSAPKVHVPTKQFDINTSIDSVYGRIQMHYVTQGNTLTFSQMVGSQAQRQDKIYTFIPLLHLRNMHKIDLHQQEHLSEVHVELLGTK